MKFPLSWLQEFLPIALSDTQVKTTFERLGIEVEKITYESLSFSGIVVAKVVKTEPHPNADTLKIAIITTGKEEYRVICGAPNCREGLFIAFAPIGSKLTDKEGKPWKIKKSKFRGIESEGMICSASELALTPENSLGVLGLPSTLPLGKDFASHISDPIFEISVTPNLGHCLSVIGLARELAAALSIKIQKKLSKPKISGGTTFPIEINTKLCPRYACRILSGINMATTPPPWITKKIVAAGLHPTNSIVDIANYVMLETGQPLHIFDLDTIASKIIVTTTKEKTTMQTLDGIVRELPEKTLIISDEEKPLAIAGIIGSFHSAVTTKTCNILIEGAVFDPNSIRKTSRAIDLTSDSGYRFARGVDIEAVTAAIDQTTTLIQEIAGGTAHPSAEHRSEPFKQKIIPLRLKRLIDSLGFDLSVNEIVSLFHRLEMSVENTQEEVFRVTIPSYRNDLSIEADLTQEIARLYGYDNIPKTTSPHIDSPLRNTPLYEMEKTMRGYLIELGLQECITCDLISPALASNTIEKELPQSSNIAVLHPRSIEQSVLRASFLPGLLQMIQHNLHHKIEDIAAFEIGRIHFRMDTTIEEPSCAAIVLAGNSAPHHFGSKKVPFDFFDIKGMVETLCQKLSIENFSFTPSNLTTLHPFRQAKIEVDKITIGVCGEINPQLLKKFDIHKKIYFTELNLPDILQIKKSPLLYKEPSPFPPSERDATLTIQASTPLETIEKEILKNKPHHLEHFYLLDIYTSDTLGKTLKNITLRFIYRSPNATLSSDMIDREHNKLLSVITTTF
jgi:phenylalanyl-tRNA synthetase beta chain